MPVKSDVRIAMRRPKSTEGVVLVTGSSGYIGSAVVRSLVRQGIATVGFDQRAPAGDLIAGSPWVIGDVRDRTKLGETMAAHRVTAVVHLAGLKSVTESFERPERYFDVNVGGTVSLIAAMVETEVDRIVFSSSAAVYGSPAKVPVDEASPIQPENPYGESKALVERMLAWYDRCHSIRFVSLRYFNAAGASFDLRFGEDWEAASNLIPAAMRSICHGQPVRVFGNDYPTADGTAVRDYIHVEDLADAHLAALSFLSSAGRSAVLNLGTGRGSSVDDVLHEIRRVSATRVQASYEPRRLGDPPRVYADASLARSQLGWRAKYGLSEIIETAWGWHAGATGGPIES